MKRCTYNNSSKLINLITMLLAKSSSLPQIKVNFNKYDQFFSNKTNQVPLDEPERDPYESALEKTQPSKTHAHNLEAIDRKSSLKSKVESYLSDGRKMGILDHTNNETSNRRSLTRISLESMKPLKTQAEQQKAYLTKLKTELNQFFEKNQSMQRQIKSTTAMHNQVSEKITYYQQLLSRSWLHRYELLNQREENLVYIRYETDRLKFMQDRLKEINILLKKKVKQAQDQLRLTEHEANTLNEIEGIRQNELDNKEYLLRHYDTFQNAKTERLAYQSTAAISKMQINEATAILKKHHNSIRIMEPQDYISEVHQHSHSKLVTDLLIQKSCAKMLDSMWTKYSSYYESYEKAEQLIKMYCMDRNMLVQDSYRRSFDVKKDLQVKIAEKEKLLEQLTLKNSSLKQQYDAQHFDEISEIEKRVDQIKKEFKTGKVQEKDVKAKEQQQYQKSVNYRLEQAQKSKHMLIRLKEWIVKREKTIEGSISKKAPLKQHFIFLITSLFKELKERENNHNIAPKVQPEKKNVQKVNKYGNTRRRNDKK